MDWASIVLVVLGIIVATLGGYVTSTYKIHQYIFVAFGSLMVILAII